VPGAVIQRSGRLTLRLVLVPLLAGCGVLPILNAGPPIYLQHPGSGRKVACEAPRMPTGPFGVHGTEPSAKVQRECVQDYQRQGYERVPD
jgi:hypothetical protein